MIFLVKNVTEMRQASGSEIDFLPAHDVNVRVITFDDHLQEREEIHDQVATVRGQLVFVATRWQRCRCFRVVRRRHFKQKLTLTLLIWVLSTLKRSNLQLILLPR